MKSNSNDNHKSQKNKKKISKKRRAIQKFITIVFCTVCLFLIVAGAATISYINNLPSNEESNFFGFDDLDNQISSDNDQKKPNIIKQLFEPKNIRTNFVLLGLDDDETRTDVIIVGTFDTETKGISLLSIPRDTRVTIPKERADILRSEGRKLPSGGVVKINEVHSYAGKKHDTEYACLQIEELLNIKIDYYVKINLEAFKYIVDTLGGVDVEIPKGGLYYNDPLQNLYINLPQGMQHLDGKKAEQFVRFGGYSDADISRIKAQQTFMKELFKQMLNKKNIMSNLTNYAYAFFKWVDTNFSVGDVPKYIGYVNDIDPANMQTYSLPGEAKYIGDTSYFLYDIDETSVLVSEIFTNSNKTKTLDQIDIDKEEDSKDKKIEVANGGYINGLANRTKDELINDGYNVVKTSTFNGQKEDRTRIIVEKAGIGEDLHNLFEDSVVVVDPALISNDVDIKIILGVNER